MNIHAGPAKPSLSRDFIWPRQIPNVDPERGEETFSPSLRDRRRSPVAFASDEFIKQGTTADALASLRPAFNKEGSVTAGNASGLNDGAAAVMVMSAARAAELGLKPLAKIKAFDAGKQQKPAGKDD